MKDPAVLFYTADFLTGTAFFTDEQRGQYIRLLCEQHQIGHIPENHMVSICLSVGSPVFKKFVKDAEGDYFNIRMEEEIEKRRKFTDGRRLNGSKGGRPREKEKPYGYPLGLATDNLIGNGNDNENINKKKNGVDYEFIIENYHTLCPRMAKIAKLTEQRKGFVNARFGEYGMETIIKVIRMAGESNFLNGKNDKAWKADFEWIVKPENFVKVMEGKYNNKVKETSLPPLSI
jgi:hypothetical protein